MSDVIDWWGGGGVETRGGGGLIDWDSSLGGFRYIQMTGHTLNNCRGQGRNRYWTL